MSNAEETNQYEVVNGSKKSSLVYIVSALLLILVVGGGFYFMSKNGEKNENEVLSQNIQAESTPKPQRPSLKGQNLADTNFADSAYQIYPGTISASAKAAMSGWDLKTIKNSDGTITASLIPTGSEVVEGDTSHTYTLQSSDKLYFVDLNPGDDQPGMDNNKNDDIGIVVDSSGIIR